MSEIKFVDVYPPRLLLTTFLYHVLHERAPEQSISHKEMPTFDQHRAFVERRPYKFWYLIQVDTEPVGSIYLTEQNEIGVFILKEHRSRGHGTRAIKLLMQTHPQEQFLANINPNNAKSLALFEGLEFRLLQLTMVSRSPK
mgnify:CR=1 FL=1